LYKFIRFNKKRRRV